MAVRTNRVRLNRATSPSGDGVSAAEARRMLLGLTHVTEGRSYGMPSFLVNGKFFARFRDKNSVLVLQLGTIGERDVLMQLAPHVFFFTEHYRDYPAVLIRLAKVPRSLVADVLTEAWRQVFTKKASHSGRKARQGKR